MNTVFLFLLSALIWGSTWYAITFQLGEVDSLWAVCYRFLLASILLGSYCCMKNSWPLFSPGQHVRLFIQGICLCGLSYWLIYESERYISSGLAAVLSTTILYFNVIVARIWLGKPVSRQVLAGGVLGSAGVALVVIPGTEFSGLADDTARGMMMVILASLLVSIGSVACEKNEGEHLPACPVLSLNMLYGAVIVAVVALVQGVWPDFDYSGSYMISLLYLVIFGSIMALTSYVALIRRIGADRAAFVDVVYPIVAIAISSIMEDYQWTLTTLAGVLLVVFGNIIALKPRKDCNYDRV